MVRNYQNKFTFQYVSIISHTCDSVRQRKDQFTFQYASIISLLDAIDKDGKY